VKELIDRRIYERTCLETSVQIKEKSIAKTQLTKNSFCKNISGAGIAIVSFNFYPVFHKVQICLFHLSYICALRTMGEVVWVEQFPYQRKYRIGIKFLEAGKNLSTQIEKIVSQNMQDVSPLNYICL